MNLLKALLLFAAVIFSTAGFAQSYPSKPIRLIVPFPPGGPADIFGRALGSGMSERLGQPVVIENIGGVGGVIGLDRLAKSAADGYTLALNNAGTLAIAPYSLSKIPYEVSKAF